MLEGKIIAQDLEKHEVTIKVSKKHRGIGVPNETVVLIQPHKIPFLVTRIERMIRKLKRKSGSRLVNIARVWKKIRNEGSPRDMYS